MDNNKKAVPYSFTFATPITNPAIEPQVDSRSYTDRMFEDFDIISGERTLLPVRAQDGSTIKTLGAVQAQQDTIPLLLNVGSKVPEYTAVNGLKQGEHVLILGGMRQGKAGQGRICLPLSEVPDFCERLLALAEAANQQLPELIKQIATK